MRRDPRLVASSGALARTSAGGADHGCGCLVRGAERAGRLTGAVFFDIALREPLVAESPAVTLCAPMVMRLAEHVIRHHVVRIGSG